MLRECQKNNNEMVLLLYLGWQKIIQRNEYSIVHYTRIMILLYVEGVKMVEQWFCCVVYSAKSSYGKKIFLE